MSWYFDMFVLWYFQKYHDIFEPWFHLNKSILLDKINIKSHFIANKRSLHPELAPRSPSDKRNCLFIVMLPYLSGLLSRIVIVMYRLQVSSRGLHWDREEHQWALQSTDVYVYSAEVKAVHHHTTSGLRTTYHCSLVDIWTLNSWSTLRLTARS